MGDAIRFWLAKGVAEMLTFAAILAAIIGSALLYAAWASVREWWRGKRGGRHGA